MTEVEPSSADLFVAGRAQRGVVNKFGNARNEVLIQKTDAVGLADPSAIFFPSGAPFGTRRVPFPGTSCASQARLCPDLIRGIRPQIREIVLPGRLNPQRRTAREFFSASLGVLEKRPPILWWPKFHGTGAPFSRGRNWRIVTSPVDDILLLRDR